MKIGDLVSPVLFGGRCTAWAGDVSPTMRGSHREVNIGRETLGIVVELPSPRMSPNFIGPGEWCRILFSTGAMLWITRGRLRLI